MPRETKPLLCALTKHISNLARLSGLSAQRMSWDWDPVPVISGPNDWSRYQSQSFLVLMIGRGTGSGPDSGPVPWLLEYIYIKSAQYN